MARGKGEGSIYKDGRGLWTAVVELPPRDGNRRRKTIRSKDKKIVVAKLRDLQRELEKAGDLETKSYTVEQWMDEWFTTIASKKNRPKTLATYRSLVKNEILPVLGKIKLDKLTPADVRRMNHGIVEKGRSSTTAAQVHRILSVALKYAEREGKVSRNVATLVDPPRRTRPDLTILNLDQGLIVLEEAAKDSQYGSLAAAVLLMGGREGELLGLEIDRVSDVLELSWQLQRITWEHGCGGVCGRKRGSDCSKRKITAPADHELRYLVGGLWLSRPKTSAGWRIPPLVDPLRTIIADHLAATSDQPNPFGLVWHKPNGMPLDPREALRWWKNLADNAGVPQTRFHDGRHTAVDLLLQAGVHIDVVSEIVGHSSRIQTEGYKSRENDTRRIEAMHSLGELIATRKAVRASKVLSAQIEGSLSA